MEYCALIVVKNIIKFKQCMNNIENKFTTQETQLIYDKMKELINGEFTDKTTKTIASNINKKIDIFIPKYPDGFISESEQIISEDLKN